jgi:glucoamylase
MTLDIERHARTKLNENLVAPGAPGEKPRWTTGAKTAVGSAVSQQSRVWFTISRGNLNEVYFPSIDEANTRRMKFLVSNGQEFFSDEETDASHRVEYLRAGVPAFRITTECKQGNYRMEKQIVSDPDRDVLLMDVSFEAFADGLRLYVVLDPHVADFGAHNEAWVGAYKGIHMLFARRHETALALACGGGFERVSVGFKGVSDGFTDVQRHKRLTWGYTEAQHGNVVLCGEIPHDKLKNRFRLTLAFGGHAAEAGQQARAGLLRKFEDALEKYSEQWTLEQSNYKHLGGSVKHELHYYRVSTAVMQMHESKRFPGAMVAGLSIPWGFDRGDEDIGGYHVIWPRDMVQAAFGKLACGDAGSARRTIFYLECTQEANGRWPQNMWLDGTPNWTATQMDGTSFGILLADQLRRTGELEHCEPWPMIRQAAAFLLQNGPVTQQERWEENPGYSPNTMAIEVAALLAAADFSDEREPNLAEFLRETADAWNEAIDELTYASGTEFGRKHGISGYYIRIAPPEAIQAGLREDTTIELKNLPQQQARKKAVEVVSPDALALVRFGLRSAKDPRMLETAKIIDATLKTQVSNGPVWHRYTDDGYGEHDNGAPFNKTGKGRGWPLLAGERAHFEIAAGNYEEADSLRRTMEAQTSECGLIPEQVWDAEDIPEHSLYNGCPTGSGMPLVWAHAEYVRLLRSLEERKVWDLPPQPVRRYQVENKTASFAIWSFREQRARLVAGKNLRLDLLAKATVRWTMNEWKSAQEIETAQPVLGLHCAMLDTTELKAGASVSFTFHWAEPDHWEGRNFEVHIIAASRRG